MTLIDFNRSGTPLVEIVTEADFRSGEEAAAYVEAIRLLVIYLNASDGKMAEGSLRCDVNISLRPEGQEAFGTKVEIKNLNSTSNVEKAIEFERQRQEKLLNDKQEINSETRRFDEATQTTVLMRGKDGVIDYRYLPDANIPATKIPSEVLEKGLPEVPTARLERYVTEYEMSYLDATTLIKNKEVSDYFDKALEKGADFKLSLNWILQELLSMIDDKKETPLEEWLPVKNFIEFLGLIETKEISSRQAKEVFKEMLGGKSAKKIIAEKGMVQVSDEGTITAWIEQVITENPRAVEDHRNGLPSAQKFVTGQVMRLSKGQANPQFTNMLVKKLLDKAI